MNNEKLDRIMDSKEFSQKFVINNPELFLSDSFDSKLKEKIINCKLTIEDLFSANKRDSEELMTKKLINNFEEDTKLLIELLGLEKTIDLYNYSKEDYKSVYESIIYLKKNSDSLFKIEIKAIFSVNSVKEIKQCIFRHLSEFNRWLKNVDDLPKEFVEKYGINKKLTILSEETRKDLIKEEDKEQFKEVTKKIIDLLGSEKALDLYNYSKEDYRVVYASIEFIKNYIDSLVSSFDFEKNLQNCQTNEIKEIVFKYIQENSIWIENYDKLPKEFVEEYGINTGLSLLLGEETRQDLIKEEDKEKFEDNTKIIIKTLGYLKTLYFYFYSKEDYKFIYETINYIASYGDMMDLIEIKRDIKQCKMTEIKKKIVSRLNKNFHKSEELSKLPIELAKVIGLSFLYDDSISKELKDKFLNKNLSLEDIINNIKLFKNFNLISNFIRKEESEQNQYVNFKKLERAIGIEFLMLMIEQCPNQIKFIINSNLVDKFIVHYNKKTETYEERTTKRINQYKENYIEKKINNEIYEKNNYIYKSINNRYNKTEEQSLIINNNERYVLGNTLSQYIEYLVGSFLAQRELASREELLNYDPALFGLFSQQAKFINLLGLQNIQKFEEETHFFSYQSNNLEGNLITLAKFVNYFSSNSNNIPELLSKHNINFKQGTLNYEEFKNEFAKLINLLRVSKEFTSSNYDWMEGDFRNNHPEIFMDKNAPEELKNKFYGGQLTLGDLEKSEFHQYLLDKNLSKLINSTTKLCTSITSYRQSYYERLVKKIHILDFCEEYTKRYGNEKFLKLVGKYGAILSDITIDCFNNEIDNEEEIEKQIRKAIYNKIVEKHNIWYCNHKIPPEFKNEYPELFVDFDSLTTIEESKKQQLIARYQCRNLLYDDIKEHKELIQLLENKNLPVIFNAHCNARDLNIINIFGNKGFLELCSRYGRYMDEIIATLEYESKIIIIDNKIYETTNLEKELTFEELINMMDEEIATKFLDAEYDYSPEDAPEYLKQKHPELFLDDNAPEELKKLFYNKKSNYHYGLKLSTISTHKKTWLPYLKGKSLHTALLKGEYGSISNRSRLLDYINIFGIEQSTKLIINRTETVQKMLQNDQVELMKEWYDKTGGKFIPDYIVMQSFNISEADKFLTSGSNWSRLMKIEGFAENAESKDALLKIAYTFGVFEQDQKGMKELLDLLTSIPQTIPEEKGYIVEEINSSLNKDFNKDYYFYPSRNEEKIKLDLYRSIKEEEIKVDLSKDIFTQLYRKNEDGSYTLTFNQQKYPKTANEVRKLLSNYNPMNLITPKIAHKFFGGFYMQYNKDFREFFLKNLDKVLNDPEGAKNLTGIQKRFNEIKVMNSNRTLTWELAVSYINQSKYKNVQPGNEKLAEISAIAGYTQEDFDTLQKIYNYGKQRTFSSIPRIENSTGKYRYEMLRLDDPLAIAIGTLTDCCQELGDAAEMCMQHSMVDKNGRVFVIRDEEGNIISQSWVWRNKDVICFDNIEVPDNAIARAYKLNPNEGEEKLSDEIYEIYAKAAKELIDADEKVYKQLLESGHITEEQYEGLRLGKVTVGLGYNDIAESIKKNSKKDNGNISRPLEFEAPIKLGRGLYTKDSNTQYILEERENRKEYNGETIAVHSDTYTEYDDTNFNDRLLLTLNKLELVTKNDPYYLYTLVENSENKIVSEIAKEYDLNPQKTKIVMNPNFAIIYEVSEDKIKIGDLFYNTTIYENDNTIDITDNVIIQIRLALEQISNGKEIDTSDLEEEQQKMYEMAIAADKEVNKESTERKLR